MTETSVRRPVWRTFDLRWIDNARAHVAAGGHAVLRGPKRWTVLLPSEVDGAMPELTAWAILDLRATGLDTDDDGQLVLTLTPGQRSQVEAWCERDAAIPTSTALVALDCLACGMCCRHNRVVLEDEDFARWTAAGRDDLASPKRLRRSRGQLVLRVLPSGDCEHLDGNACTIYALRPNNCRAFPMGSEGCLSAREEAGLLTV